MPVPPETPVAMLTIGQLVETLKEHLQADQQPANVEPESMDVEDVCRLLGGEGKPIHPKTLRELIKRGLPCVNMGGRLRRFRRSEVLEWMDQHKSA